MLLLVSLILLHQILFLSFGWISTRSKTLFVKDKISTKDKESRKQAAMNKIILHLELFQNWQRVIAYVIDSKVWISFWKSNYVLLCTQWGEWGWED